MVAIRHVYYILHAWKVHVLAIMYLMCLWKPVVHDLPVFCLHFSKN